jgi:hypothetical protein
MICTPSIQPLFVTIPIFLIYLINGIIGFYHGTVICVSTVLISFLKKLKKMQKFIFVQEKSHEKINYT